MKKKCILGAFLIALSCPNGIRSQERIINGNEVSSTDSKWKSIVGLLIAPSSDYFLSHFCGGTLIHPEWVLTAAHCIYNYDQIMSPDEILIYYNSYDLDDLDKTGKTVKVQQVIPHSLYSSLTMDNDIALLRLSEQVTAIPVVGLRKTDPSAGSDAWVAGWGNLSTSEVSFPSKLMEANVPVVDFNTCRESYENIRPIRYIFSQNMFCAGYMQSNKDSCQGDSGGPLIIQKNGTYELAGIVSFGEECAQDGFPGVYVKVNNYLDWVSNNTRLSFDSYPWTMFLPAITGKK